MKVSNCRIVHKTRSLLSPVMWKDCFLYTWHDCVAFYSTHLHLLLRIKLGPGRLKQTAFCNLFPLFKTRDFDSLPLIVLLTIKGPFPAPSETASWAASTLCFWSPFCLLCVHNSMSLGFTKGRICVCLSCFVVIVEKGRMDANCVLLQSVGRNSAFLKQSLSSLI